MPARPRTPLEHALLGLLLEQPRSGYALRRVFAETPIGRFSSSPGAIYPALARLEQQGLLQGRVDRTHPRRPARVLRLTAAGRRQVLAWIEGPVTAEDARERPDDLLLRFAFLPFANGDAPAFLAACESAWRAEAAALAAWLDSEGRELSPHHRLAVEHGIASHEASAAWAAHAAATLRRGRKTPPRTSS